jgi:WhiB family redox-sensing transcriptional regulator
MLDAMELLWGGSDWMGAALCSRSTHPDLWFPERGGSMAPAVGVCSRCPVKAPCLDYAIDNKIEEGVWGGESARGRRKIARERRKHPAGGKFSPSGEVAAGCNF